MGLSDLIPLLEEEIADPEQETFELFAQKLPEQDLGFVDKTASEVQVAIHGAEYTIRQSPAVLGSNRAGGTTGAVLWRIAPLFAAHISTPSTPLFKLISPSTSILELGCGISPLTALSLSPHVSSYVLTDQSYVQKLIQENISANTTVSSSSTKNKGRRGTKWSKTEERGANVSFAALDWETDDPTPEAHGVPDLVIATDCVYNYDLVKPLVQACAEACRLRRASEGISQSPRAEGDGCRIDDLDAECVCLVAQQLRSDDVFGEWLAEFHKSFRVWRVPDEMMSPGLRSDAGFVVHLGVLR